jgi:hypothetical protein
MVNRLNHKIAQERVADALRAAERERRAAALVPGTPPLHRRVLLMLRERMPVRPVRSVAARARRARRLDAGRAEERL